MNRIEQVRDFLNEENLDAIWISNEKNIFYLSGFTGSTAEIVISKDNQYFITDFRYKEQAASQAKDYKIIIREKSVFEEMNDILVEQQIKSLAFEANHVTYAQFVDVDDILETELVETRGVVEEIRLIKSEEEIEIMKEACEITDQAFDHILTFIKPGVTELEVANEIEHFLKQKGASSMSFDTIIASGVRSSMPHGRASEKVIEDGDIVTLDFGCYYKGYSSDITRTIAVGEIDPKLVEIYHIVLEAHNRVIEQAKPGMTGKEVDAIARDYITEKGYGPDFGHSTGHGLGLDVHESLAISKLGEQILEEGMIFTDEPGIYIEGLGGVRIEDDLVVRADGMESLNCSPKELIIL